MPVQCNTYADFKFEKTALQWLAISRGHRVIYGVRFHSECAPVESMWAYIVSVLRPMLDGKASTLVTNLVSCLAHTIKPDVAGRLFNRPTECWQLYTLTVGANLSLAAGLSAESVFALQRAYSGYGNTKASTSGHARSSVMGTLADALGDALGDAEDESDAAAGDELRETGTAAPFRAVPTGAGTNRVAAAAGGAGPGVPFVSSPVPEEVPPNLWELLSCVKESIRRAVSPLLTT